MGTFARTGYVKVNPADVPRLPPPPTAKSEQPDRAPWEPARVRRTTWRFWHRLALRLLGVPYGQQNLLLDERRWTISVSNHAVKQAGERYRQGDPTYITLDIAAALCDSRIGTQAPGKSKAHGRAMHAWSEDASRVYVIRRAKRGWVVVTALPTAWSDGERERREKTA